MDDAVHGLDGSTRAGASPGMPRSTAWALVAFIVLACTLTILPFLRLIEFSNGGENAVVGAVQEVRRGGSWLVPTLLEEARTKKPPLATWVSAIVARPSTVEDFSHPDAEVRDKAFRDFAFQVRLPALLAMGGVLVATYVLGAHIGGRTLGVVACAVCGTSLFWLQSARLATTDAQLSLWVGIANCLLAIGVFERKWWPALAGGGAALGLGMMSKGPVAIVQTVAPVLAFMAWRGWRARANGAAAVQRARVNWVAPLVVGVVLFAVIGLSWYAMVLTNRPDVLEEWKREVTREGATDLEPSKWYNYVGLLVQVLPWTFFLIVGLIDSVATAVKGPTPGDERRGRIVLALMLLVVPVLIMSLFRDRKIRYLLPLLTPTSIVAAWGVVEIFSAGVRRRAAAWMTAAFHWLPLLVACAGLPLVGAQLLPLPKEYSLEGVSWYSAAGAVAASTGFIVLIFAAVLLQRHKPVLAVAGCTLVAMLGWNAMFNAGYRYYSEGRSEVRPIAEQIWEDAPDATVFSYRADRPARHAPIDLSIYLNRAVKPVATDDAPELADTPGPRVFVVRQKHTTPLADPTPLAPKVGGPWRFMLSERMDEATWYAFVAGAAPAP